MATSPRKFVSTKRVSLAVGGEGWEESYALVSIPSMAETQSLLVTAPTTAEEAQAMAQEVLRLLQDHFVSGQAPYEGSLVDITKEDVPELPVNVINELRENITGSKVLSPNS